MGNGMKYKWWIIGIAVFLGLPRLYRQIFERRYGLADIYYYADILKAHKVQEPAWTNCDPIYVAMDWKLQQSYLDQVEGRIPEGMETYAWFDIHDHLPQGFKIQESGYTVYDVPLQRGWYKWLRLLIIK